MRRIATAWIAVVALAVSITACRAPTVDPGRRSAPPPLLPPPLFGVTVDDVDAATSAVPVLSSLPVRPVTRIYFDVNEPPGAYLPVVKRIHQVSGVMGELLDSSDETAITVSGLDQRTASYLALLGPYVDIWEIGNEVNGNWLGPYPTVSAKLVAAYHAVADRRYRSALTLYVNDFRPHECGAGPGELTPSRFSREYVPADVADGLSYVFLSYYPGTCAGVEPSSAQLRSYLVTLHQIYPHALLGFGEVGLEQAVTPADVRGGEQVMRWAYSLKPGLPYYVGGYFWWYAAEDALRPGAPLGPSLVDAFRREMAALSPAG